MRIARLGTALLATVMALAWTAAGAADKAVLLHQYTFADNKADDAVREKPLHGKLMGEPTFVANARPGMAALKLDGKDEQFVQFEAFQFSDRFSLAAWVKLEDWKVDQPGEEMHGRQRIQVVVANKVGGSTDGFAFFANNPWGQDQDASLQFESGVEGQHTQTIAPKDVTAGKWHHVAAAVDKPAGLVTLFIDGKQVKGIESRLTPNFKTAGEWRIGAFIEGNHPFKGLLADVRVYSGLLTADEAAELAK